MDQADGCGRTLKGSMRYKAGLKHGYREGRDKEMRRQRVQ